MTELNVIFPYFGVVKCGQSTSIFRLMLNVTVLNVIFPYDSFPLSANCLASFTHEVRHPKLKSICDYRKGVVE